MLVHRYQRTYRYSRIDGPNGDYRGEAEILESEIIAWKRLLKKNPGGEESKAADSQLKVLDSEMSKVQQLFKLKGKKRRRDDE